MDSELKTLWQRYHKGRKIADRNLLIEHYRPLVEFHAQRVKARLPPEVELDDMVSTGVFGLADAIEAFDPGRGVKFESYSTHRIRGAMLDELREMDWVPRLVRARASLLKNAREELQRKLGREPTVKELAKSMKLKVPEVERMQRETEPVGLISLSKKWFETDSFKDVQQVLLVDRRAEDPHARSHGQDILRILLKSLKRQERLLVIGYYWEGLTMKQIGKQLGLSESRVSHMHSQLIAELQRRLASRLPEIAAA